MISDRAATLLAAALIFSVALYSLHLAVALNGDRPMIPLPIDLPVLAISGGVFLWTLKTTPAQQ